MKTKKVLTIGGGTQDIFISYKDAETVQFESKQGTRSCLLLEEGAKIEVSDIVYATGGGATNSGVSASAMATAIPVDKTRQVMRSVVEDLSKLQKSHNGLWSQLEALIRRLESQDPPESHATAFNELKYKMRAVSTAFSDTDLAIREARRG